jgi:hypothetical protein
MTAHIYYDTEDGRRFKMEWCFVAKPGPCASCGAPPGDDVCLVDTLDAAATYCRADCIGAGTFHRRDAESGRVLADGEPSGPPRS